MFLLTPQSIANIPKASPYKKTLNCFSLEDNFEMKSRKFLSEYFRLGSIWRLQSLQMQESQSQSLPILTDGRLKEPHIQTIFNLCKFLQRTCCKSHATYVNFSQSRKCKDLFSNNVEPMSKNVCCSQYECYNLDKMHSNTAQKICA